MRTREIKDLCIAREALSRIPGYDAERTSERVHKLIEQLLEEGENPGQLRKPQQYQSPDDEIPF